MKSLYIVRHAKSSWEHPEQTDEERPVLEKGVKRTQKVIRFLKEKEVNIDMIISSHAKRAFETAKLIAEGLGYPEEAIRVEKGIYHGDTDDLMEYLYSLPDDIKSVMVVGHNPEFTHFANNFLDEEIDWIPTSGVVGIDFKAEHWKDLLDSDYSKSFVVFPKQLSS